MNDRQVELVPEPSVEVRSKNGARISGFWRVDEWRGLVAYANAKGQTLIVASGEGAFGQVLSALWPELPTSATVIMGSPDLLEILFKEQPK